MLTRKRLVATAAWTLLLGLLPAIVAYESSLVNVTSHVVYVVPPGNSFAVAEAAVIEVDADGDGYFDPVDGPDYLLEYDPAMAFPEIEGGFDETRVYAGAVACWELSITVSNGSNNHQGEVVLVVPFGAQRLLDGTFLRDAIDVFRISATGGRFKRDPVISDSFTTQVEVTWYPGLDLGEPGPGEEGFSPGSSELFPGETHVMDVIFCTKRNHNFSQEFVSLEEYGLTPGSTTTWSNPRGSQFSYQTASHSVEVIVYEGEEEDEDYGRALEALEDALERVPDAAFDGLDRAVDRVHDAVEKAEERESGEDE